ncbi:hypothetical protein Bxe_B0511 [Paraburkholderia xenovorans LB400]|uniref:Uncharacterized protein n=1 Tax=Paraburkholderia xenovorans (strain LB400) TaxID=266265 RepID=Q13KF3_PARXL|nr:hypothetical protein Bxe_B0511 [Paraburkholderia xenovorans LB400]
MKETIIFASPVSFSLCLLCSDRVKAANMPGVGSRSESFSSCCGFKPGNGFGIVRGHRKWSRSWFWRGCNVTARRNVPALNRP